MSRLRALLAKYVLDAVVVAGYGLIAYGAGQIPEPWGAVLGPVVLGLGLVATVRLGAR